MKKNPVVHFEMPYKDAERAADFYTTAFGWEMQPLGEKMGNYVMAHTTETDEHQMVKEPGSINGGFFPFDDKREFTTPSVVIAVDDIEAGMEQVKKAGGEVLGEVADITGVGKYVMFADTEGNKVSMLQSQAREVP